MECLLRVYGKDYQPLVWKEKQRKKIETEGILIQWKYPVIITKRTDLIFYQKIWTVIDGKKIDLVWIKNNYEWNILCLTSDQLPKTGITKDKFLFNYQSEELILKNESVEYIKTETVEIAPYVSIRKYKLNTDCDNGIVITKDGQLVGLMIDVGYCLPVRLLLPILSPHYGGMAVFPISIDKNLCVTESYCVELSKRAIVEKKWKLLDEYWGEVDWNLYWNLNYHVGDIISFNIIENGEAKLITVDLVETNNIYRCRLSSTPNFVSSKAFIIEVENFIISYLSREMIELISKKKKIVLPIDEIDLMENPLGANIIVIYDITNPEKAKALGYNNKIVNIYQIKKIGKQIPMSPMMISNKFVSFKKRMTMFINNRVEEHDISFHKGHVKEKKFD